MSIESKMSIYVPPKQLTKLPLLCYNTVVSKHFRDTLTSFSSYSLERKFWQFWIGNFDSLEKEILTVWNRKFWQFGKGKFWLFGSLATHSLRTTVIKLAIEISDHFFLQHQLTPSIEYRCFKFQLKWNIKWISTHIHLYKKTGRNIKIFND
jgi:hypothetical protein